MSLTNLPQCDICFGIDFDDVLVTAWDVDTQEDMQVCPDCLEINTDLVLEEPDPGDEIDRVYEEMRDGG